MEWWEERGSTDYYTIEKMYIEGKLREDEVSLIEAANKYGRFYGGRENFGVSLLKVIYDGEEKVIRYSVDTYEQHVKARKLTSLDKLKHRLYDSDFGVDVTISVKGMPASAEKDAHIRFEIESLSIYLDGGRHIPIDELIGYKLLRPEFKDLDLQNRFKERNY